MESHSPNDGENNMHFSGNSEGGRTMNVVDKAGVVAGLSTIEDCGDCKNMGEVSDNQRPMAMSTTFETFKIGT